MKTIKSMKLVLFVAFLQLICLDAIEGYYLSYFDTICDTVYNPWRQYWESCSITHNLNQENLMKDLMSLTPDDAIAHDDKYQETNTLLPESRDAMKRYWDEHSVEGSMEEMMLDSNAVELSAYEEPEILRLLPDINGKDVIDLGAGIGRYTALFAERVKGVTAVDFVESFIEKNYYLNRHFGNIRFIQADAAEYDHKTNSLDLVFSNWLLMYPNDGEVLDLFKRQLLWLREGGYVFFRESCFHSSGNAPRTENPTKYRDPNLYNSLIKSATVPTEDGKNEYGYEIIFSRPIQTYFKRKGNPNQICWLMKKARIN